MKQTSKRNLWQSLYDTEEHKELMADRYIYGAFDDPELSEDEVAVLKQPNSYLDEHPFLCKECLGEGCLTCDMTGIVKGARELAQGRIDERNAHILDYYVDEKRQYLDFDRDKFLQAEVNLYDKYRLKSMNLMANAIEGSLNYLSDPSNIQYSYGSIGKSSLVDDEATNILLSSSGSYRKETSYFINLFRSKMYRSPYYGGMLTDEDVFDRKVEIPDFEFILLKLDESDLDRCFRVLDTVMKNKQLATPVVAISTMTLSKRDPLGRWEEYSVMYDEKIPKYLL